MPLTARFRLCSRDLAWADVFAISARSSALFTSIIGSVEYHLLLVFFNVKPFLLLDMLIFVICP